MKTSASSSSLRGLRSRSLPTDASAIFGKAPRPLRSLGQNFLASEHYRDQIIRTLSLDQETSVLELGPGRGSLTTKLASVSKLVTAIEIDRILAEELKSAFFKTNVCVHHADAMKIDFAEFVDASSTKNYFVANLPYYLATPLVVKAVASGCFNKIAFMIQKELAERFVASKGSKAYGAVSVLLQSTCSIRILFQVPRSAFFPVPKVDSCFVELTPFNDKKVSTVAFGRFLKSCFSSRRKTIRNNLQSFVESSSVSHFLRVAGIDEGLRPEQLSSSQFEVLFDLYSRHDKA